MTLFNFLKKKGEDAYADPKIDALAKFSSGIAEPVLKFVSNYPATVYSIGSDAEYYDYGLALAFLLRLERDLKIRHSTISDIARLSGFTRSVSEGRVNIFVDYLYSEKIYETLKRHLKGLKYRILGATYITVTSAYAKEFPEPKMHGFGPICLTHEEKELERHLTEKYGELKDQRMIINSQLPQEYAAILNMGDLICAYAEEKNVWDGEFERLFEANFAKPAYKINTDVSNPQHRNPARVVFGNLTNKIWNRSRKCRDIRNESLRQLMLW
jgi:hypothetical protein